MAYSIANTKKSVFGDVRICMGTITTDASSGAVAMPGMSVLIGASVTPKSAATGGFNVAINQAAGGTTTNGSLRIMSAASGDDFFVVVYGR